MAGACRNSRRLIKCHFRVDLPHSNFVAILDSKRRAAKALEAGAVRSDRTSLCISRAQERCGAGMADSFDPYHVWLSIPPGQRPPTHYQLLAISVDERDRAVISAAVTRQSAYVRNFQVGKHSADAARILNEIQAAKLCLLDPAKRAEYDAQLGPREAPAATAAAAQSAPPAGLLVDLDDLSGGAAPASPQPMRQLPRLGQPKKSISWHLPAVVGLAAVVLVIGLIAFLSRRNSGDAMDGPAAVAISEKVGDPQTQQETGNAAAAATSPQDGDLPEASIDGDGVGDKMSGQNAAVPKVASLVTSTAEPPAPVESPPPASPQASAEPPLAIAPFDAQQARAHQEAWAKYLKTAVEQQNSLGMRLALIPPGEFTMGSTPEQIEAAKLAAKAEKKTYLEWTLERIEAEAPAHRVKITRPLLMGATEVTIGQYRRFIEASGYVTETERFGGGSSTKKEERDPAKKSLTWRAPSYFSNESSAATQITWNDCIAFCNWLSDAEKLSRCYVGDEQAGWRLSTAGNGYRLPTEAEWEYACRAGTTMQYGFGDDASTFAQYGWSDKTGAIPFPVSVGSKAPNSFGLYDMHGNVEEWCYDWFSPTYYAESPGEDPAGPAEGSTRVKRGGAWDGPLVNARAAFRHSYAPYYRFGDLGFRVVRVWVANSEFGTRISE
jgi:formylglycine-generating enzyme required for sulfatase activity